MIRGHGLYRYDTVLSSLLLLNDGQFTFHRQDQFA